MLVMIDNYDSFTYNLVQFLGEIGVTEMKVFRNDKVTLEEIEALQPTHIVVSPGPCTPNEAGISMAAISHFAPKGISILGVCLGHQSIGQVFGGKVIRGDVPVHGKTSPVYHDGKKVFAGIKEPFTATRYHSLIVDRETLPDCLEITAWLEDGTIMGIRHKEYPVEGLQFHPESVLTEVGHDLLRNFISLKGKC
ncbi:MAG: anthranilate synthase component II [bacterium]